MFETVAQQRGRRLRELNQPFDTPAKSLVQRKHDPPEKHLPVQGTHFLRKDVYDLPSESEEDDDGIVPVRQGRADSKRRNAPDPDDSPLSEDELEAVYAASPVRSPSSSSVPQASDSRTSSGRHVQCRVPVGARGKKGIAKPVPQSKVNSKTATSDQTLVTKPSRKLAVVPDTSITGSIDNKPRVGTSKPKLKPKLMSKPLKPSKLHVNELQLASSAEHHQFVPPPSRNPADVHTPETIAKSSSSAPKRARSSHESLNGTEVEAPLTSIRKRLKTPRFTHKSVAMLRKKSIVKKSLFGTADENRNVGDGFEVSELKTNHNLPVTHRKQRTTRKPLLLGFSALQLQSGPLPEVKFQPNSPELLMDAGHDSDNSYVQPLEQDNDHLDRNAGISHQKTEHKVSFSDRVLSDVVREQLSSISAPKRPISISSDQSSDDLEEYDDSEDGSPELAADNGDRTSEHDRLVSDMPSEPPVAAASLVQRNMAEQRGLRQSSRPVFVRSMVQQSAERQQSEASVGIGVLPKASWNNGRLVEVDDTIFDDPDAEKSTSRTPLRGHNLIEVNEMIDEAPDRHPQFRPSQADAAIWSREHDMLDEMEGSVYARSYISALPQSDSRSHRPRSILRNADVPRSHDTRPEDTAANTRRNSTINLEEHEQSRYFATASSMLHQPHQPAHVTQPRIIKMRSNYLARQASLSEAAATRANSVRQVQVPDSETVVQETSPEPPDYTNSSTSSQLNILRRGQGAMWTSSESLPMVPRDLKALTRSVSREHGTLSQSVRRKPSMPFQSPTKIR